MSAAEALADVAAGARPSVVQVRVHGRGIGAGVVWDSAGGIVTAQHVVGEVDGPFEVVLTDGRRVQGWVASRHPAADLALLRVQASGLLAAPRGDSTALRVGQLVVAIGHPWGQPDVVTAGIVSAVGALPGPGGRSVDCIRSDVRLAPGNSGGPLLDAAGRVVGISSMIWGGDMAVAIPIHVVQRWLAQTPAGAAQAA